LNVAAAGDGTDELENFTVLYRSLPGRGISAGGKEMRVAARMNGRLESRPTGRLESLPYIIKNPAGEPAGLMKLN
jgi:hypothetical protein